MSGGCGGAQMRPLRRRRCCRRAPRGRCWAAPCQPGHTSDGVLHAQRLRGLRRVAAGCAAHVPVHAHCGRRWWGCRCLVHFRGAPPLDFRSAVGLQSMKVAGVWRATTWLAGNNPSARLLLLLLLQRAAAAAAAAQKQDLRRTWEGWSWRAPYRPIALAGESGVWASEGPAQGGRGRKAVSAAAV